MLRIRMPGRHLFVGDFFANGLGPGTRVLVGKQRHRSDLTGPVTARATLVEDGSDIF